MKRPTGSVFALCCILAACDQGPDPASPHGHDQARSEGEGWSTLDEEGGSIPSETDRATPEDVEPGTADAADRQDGAPCPDPDAIATLPACCDEGLARCVPAESIPATFSSLLDPCGDDGACVPQAVLEGMASPEGYMPRSCASLGGVDGACISVCIPRVRDVMEILPQDVCQADERCAPCIDPLTGADSGACAGSVGCQEQAAGGAPELPDEEAPPPVYGCDAPPEEPIVDIEAFTSCCDGARCVPKALVPEADQKDLADCDEGAGSCVPEGNLAFGGLVPSPVCDSVGGLEGRCISTCVPEIAANAEVLPTSSCEPGERCSPCCDPFTGEATGACEKGCDLGPEEPCGVPLYATCCGGLGHCVDPELVPDDKAGSLSTCKGEESDMLCVPDEMQQPGYEGAACSGDGVLLGAYDGVCLPDCLKLPLKFTYDHAACPAGYTCTPCLGPFGGPTDAPGCQT